MSIDAPSSSWCLSSPFRAPSCFLTRKPAAASPSPLVEGEHYLAFWKDANDIFDVLARHGDNDVLLRNISRSAQQFASKYTSRAVRMIYLRQVLVAYADLYPGMATLVADLAGRFP